MFACSKFITDQQLPLLEKALLITAKEKSATMAQYNETDQQAYHMMITWRSRPLNNSQQKLICALDAVGLYDAIDK